MAKVISKSIVEVMRLIIYTRQQVFKVSGIVHQTR